MSKDIFGLFENSRREELKLFLNLHIKRRDKKKDKSLKDFTKKQNHLRKV